uniref:Nudix hydrolase domain-containing protein n=1 Tax=Salix viminalis TaxID=40686 RepID=A0A6N2KEN0_SALVM
MAGLVCSKSGMEHVLVENEVQQVKLLDSVNDDHGGVIVELSEAMDLKVFALMLKASIALWRSQGKRGVWIKIPIELINLAEAAVKEGFWFHHAEPKYLMLAFWIPEGAHTLPANASHCVLVVQEKNGIFRGTGIWKFPTGGVDEGEDICAGAIREVKEETAIDTEFVEVLAFWYEIYCNIIYHLQFKGHLMYASPCVSSMGL